MMYYFNKKSLYTIIGDYKKGRQFRPFQFGDSMYLYASELIDLSKEYGVNPEDFGLTDHKIYEYFNKYSGLEFEFDFDNLLCDIERDDLRLLLFCSALSIPISLFICFVLYHFIEGDDKYVHFLPFTLGWGFFPYIFFFYLSYKYLYPYFCKWYSKKQLQKFYNNHGITYDKDIYNFINEVMFQAFVKNRKPLNQLQGTDR